MNIQFIGFSPDRTDKFMTFVMLMVGSIVEATWVNRDPDSIETEVILIAGATEQEGLYFSRSLEMSKYEWILKQKAEKGRTGTTTACNGAESDHSSTSATMRRPTNTSHHKRDAPRVRVLRHKRNAGREPPTGDFGRC